MKYTSLRSSGLLQVSVREFRRVDAAAAFASSLQPHAQRDQDQAAEERAGNRQKGEHAQIGILGLSLAS